MRPSWTKSLRFQLTAGYVAALGVILLLAAAFSYAAIRASLVREADQALSAEAARLLPLLTPSPESPSENAEADDRPDPARIITQAGPPFAALPGIPAQPILLRLSRTDTGDTVAVSPALRKRPALLAALTATAAERNGPLFSGSEEDQMRCLTVPVPRTPFRLQVAALWDPTDDFLLRVLTGIGLAGLLFLLLSGIGSWLLIGRALSPIDQIVTEAENLTAEPLTTDRLLPPALLSTRTHSDDEVGHLVTALNAMMSRLSAAFAAQKQFTADASHELRTPLTILQGQFELALTRPRSASEYRQTLESGLEEILRMSRIVESLMFLARGDAGTTPVDNRRSVSLAPLAEEVLASLTLRASEKNLRLLLKVETEDALGDMIVRGEPDALRRLIRNLLENALAYTPSGGEITMTLAAGETSHSLTVTDTGVGIASEDLPFVFDRFFRADKARVNTGGSGLGLSIARNIAAEHGGSIGVESKPGTGSRFTLTLPKIRKV